MRFCADQRSATELESCSGEKRTRIPCDASTAAHPVLILPTTSRPPPLLLFPTPADDNEGLHQSGRSSEAVHLSSSPTSFRSGHFPLFSLLSRFFLFVLQNGQHGHPHNIRSSLHRHHSFFIVRVKLSLCHWLWVWVACSQVLRFAVASSGSFRCSVTHTTTGILWIDRFTRYWCVSRSLSGKEFSHTGPPSIGGSAMVRAECLPGFALTT